MNDQYEAEIQRLVECAKGADAIWRKQVERLERDHAQALTRILELLEQTKSLTAELASVRKHYEKLFDEKQAATDRDFDALKARLERYRAASMPLIAQRDAARAMSERLVDNLSGLLADTQHSDHSCGDVRCPVDSAREALAAYELTKEGKG